MISDNNDCSKIHVSGHAAVHIYNDFHTYNFGNTFSWDILVFSIG